MILSMTGYGKGEARSGHRNITIELKSLNGKTTDIKIRLPQRYREKEMDIRKMVKKHAERGKLELFIDVTVPEGGNEYVLNEGLFRSYYKKLAALEFDLGAAGQSDLVSGILRIPGVVDVPKDDITDEEWEALRGAVKSALDQLYGFRQNEGAAMKKDLEQRVNSISSLLEKTAPFEKDRIEKVRQRIRQNMEDFVGRENVDENRFEQEIIFYLEKLDVNEEKVRLKQHCKYFLEQLSKEEVQKGRTLAFISQEMGREINTLGSKAYSSEIQRLVVKMKDELEKIKEQAANIV